MDYMGDLQKKMEKTEPVFDTQKKVEERESTNKTVDYIKLADEQNMLKGKELEKEQNYIKQADNFDKFKETEIGRYFADEKSYGDVIRTLDKLKASKKVKLTDKIMEQIRQSAKAYFIERDVDATIEVEDFASKHETLEANEKALLDSWRVKGDSKQMRNLKTSIRTLRAAREERMFSIETRDKDAIDVVMKKKAHMDRLMDNVMADCRTYMRHVGDPGSDAGKKRLRLASDILTGLQMEKNNEDALEFSRRNILWGLTAFPLGIEIRWHDLVEYMERAEDIYNGGTENDTLEGQKILSYLNNDCIEKGNQKELIPGLKVKSKREIMKAVVKASTGFIMKELNYQVKHTGFKSQGQATEITYQDNENKKSGYYFGGQTEAALIRITKDDFFYDDKKLISIGITEDQIPSFREDMKRLIDLSEDSHKREFFIDQMGGLQTHIFFDVDENGELINNNLFYNGKEHVKGFGISDRENKAKADSVMKEIENYVNKKVAGNTNNYLYNPVKVAALQDIMDCASEIFAKYNIDVARAYTDSEIDIIEARQNKSEKNQNIINKLNSDYEKDTVHFKDVEATMDSMEVTTKKTVNIAGVNMEIAKSNYFDATKDYALSNLDDQQLEEVKDIVEEFNTVYNKAVVYTDMRRRIVDSGGNFEKAAPELEEYDLFKNYYDEIEKKYKDSYVISVKEKEKEVIDNLKANGTYAQKFALEHIEEIYGISEDRLSDLTFVVSLMNVDSLKQDIAARITPEMIEQVRNDEGLDSNDLDLLEAETDKDWVVTRLAGILKEIYSSHIYLNKNEVISEITSKFNEQRRGNYDFENEFKSNGSVAYSDEFISKNAQWLVNGHGKKEHFRAKLWNKQKYYVDRSAELGKKLTNILNKANKQADN